MLTSRGIPTAFIFIFYFSCDLFCWFVLVKFMPKKKMVGVLVSLLLILFMPCVSNLHHTQPKDGLALALTDNFQWFDFSSSLVLSGSHGISS